MKKVLLSTLLLSASIGSAQAVTMGPYGNIGIGVTNFTLANFLNDGSDLTKTSLSGRLGFGYLDPIDSSANPFFWGLEFNGNYYSMSNSNNASLFGLDLDGILGKQLNNTVSLYGKLMANALTAGGHYIVGPGVGAGLGFQLTQNIRLNTEVDSSYELVFRVTSYTAGLQIAL